MEKESWLPIAAIVGVVAIVAIFGLTSITGNATLKDCGIMEHCQPGEYFSTTACKCLKEAQGKSDLVSSCQRTCGIGNNDELIIEELVALDGTREVKGLDIQNVNGYCTCISTLEKMCSVRFDCLIGECLTGCYSGCDAKVDCIAIGGDWIQESNNLKTNCMKECLGVPLGDGNECPINDGTCVPLFRCEDPGVYNCENGVASCVIC